MKYGMRHLTGECLYEYSLESTENGARALPPLRFVMRMAPFRNRLPWRTASNLIPKVTVGIDVSLHLPVRCPEWCTTGYAPQAPDQVRPINNR